MMFLIQVLLLITQSFSSAMAAETLVRVRPHIVVAPESEVKLIQLIDEQNLSKASRDRLAAISISQAPKVGERQEISRSNLMDVLRPIVQAERSQNGAKVHLVLPKSVLVDTIKRDLDKELVSMELMQAWAPLCDDCQLEIESLSLPKIESIKDWTLKLKAELPKGSFSIPVDIIRENDSLIQAWISGRLIAKRKMPVAKRAIAYQERLQAGDFSFEYRDTTYSIDGIPTSEEITGKRLKQALRAGDILWKGNIEKEKAIKVGDVVQLRSGEGSWEITMNVVAQQDGFIGDLVNLKNPKTNTVLVGHVTGLGEAELR